MSSTLEDHSVDKEYIIVPIKKTIRYPPKEPPPSLEKEEEEAGETIEKKVNVSLTAPEISVKKTETLLKCDTYSLVGKFDSIFVDGATLKNSSIFQENFLNQKFSSLQSLKASTLWGKFKFSWW